MFRQIKSSLVFWYLYVFYPTKGVCNVAIIPSQCRYNAIVCTLLNDYVSDGFSALFLYLQSASRHQAHNVKMPPSLSRTDFKRCHFGVRTSEQSAPSVLYSWYAWLHLRDF